MDEYKPKYEPWNDREHVAKVSAVNAQRLLRESREQGFFIADWNVYDDHIYYLDALDETSADAWKRRVPYVVLWATEMEGPERVSLAFNWGPLRLSVSAGNALLDGAASWIHQVVPASASHAVVIGDYKAPHYFQIELDREHADIAARIFVKKLNETALSLMRIEDAERARQNGALAPQTGNAKGDGSHDE